MFDFEALPDGALLTEIEAAAVGRWSTNTLSTWRKRRDHPLKWTAVGGGRVRYRAGDVRQFLASGERPRPGRPKANAAPPPKIISQDAAPPRRRAPARPRAADDLAAAQEPSS